MKLLSVIIRLFNGVLMGDWVVGIVELCRSLCSASGIRLEHRYYNIFAWFKENRDDVP